MTTNQIEFNIAPVAECSVLVTLTLSPSNNQSSAEYAQYMAHFSDAIRQHLASILMNVTPAYHTILVDYLPYRISEHQLMEQLNALLSHAISSFSSVINTRNTIDLPAYYSPETALDLDRYQAQGMSLDDIIQYHTFRHTASVPLGLRLALRLCLMWSTSLLCLVIQPHV